MNGSPERGAQVHLAAAPLLIAALLQALALFALYRGAEADAAFAVSPLPAVPLWTLVVVLPAQFLLLFGSGPLPRLLTGLAGSSVLFLLVSAWTGHQLEPEDEIPEGAVLSAYVFLTALLAFKVTVWLQQWVEGRRPDYASLLEASWRCFLLPSQALVFVGLFGAVLALWAALFDLVGIGVFEELFTEDWFLFPVLGLAFGTGILLFRRMPGLLGGVDERLRVAMTLLLPLVLAVGIAFLAVLPFTGVDALWDTGRGTALLLWLLAFVTFFLNAVYAPGAEDPYPRWLGRLLPAAVLLLPVVALLASWGLWIRIDQYGLTVDRFWALVVWGMLAAFAFAYAGMVLRLRARWRDGLGPVNLVMSLLLVAILVLAHSPLLDPKALSAASQLARLERGAVALEDLDLQYFRRSLGRPGWRALAALREAHGEDRVAALLWPAGSADGVAPNRRQALLDDLIRIPPGLVLPEHVRERIADTADEARLQRRGRQWVIERDLDRDGRGDFVFLYEMNDWLFGLAWVSGGREVHVMHGISVEGSHAELEQARRQLDAFDVDTDRPEIDDLLLGELRVRIR